MSFQIQPLSPKLAQKFKSAPSPSVCSCSASFSSASSKSCANRWSLPWTGKKCEMKINSQFPAQSTRFSRLNSASKDNNNEPKKTLTLNEDSKVMLPAIKVSSHHLAINSLDLMLFFLLITTLDTSLARVLLAHLQWIASCVTFFLLRRLSIFVNLTINNASVTPKKSVDFLLLLRSV